MPKRLSTQGTPKTPHFYWPAQVGVRAWPHAVISSLGARARGGVVRLWRSVSHVVRQGHMLTSDWVPLGPVRARRGSSGIRMGPYLSRTPIRVHPVFRQGSSGPVGSRRDISAKSAKVRSGPKTSNLVRNGSRIDRLARNKDQMNRIACPDPSGPLLRPKTAKKCFF